MVHSSDRLAAARGYHCRASNLESLKEAILEFASEFSGAPLSAKLRELLILDMAWRTGSAFLWYEHLDIAIAVGITDLHLAAIQQRQLEACVFTGGTMNETPKYSHEHA